MDLKQEAVTQGIAQELLEEAQEDAVTQDGVVVSLRAEVDDLTLKGVASKQEMAHLERRLQQAYELRRTLHNTLQVQPPSLFATFYVDHFRVPRGEAVVRGGCSVWLNPKT